MNGLSALKLFQRSNGDLKFSEHAYSIYKVRKPRMTELGQGVGVRAHYPIRINCKCFLKLMILHSFESDQSLHWMAATTGADTRGRAPVPPMEFYGRGQGATV